MRKNTENTISKTYIFVFTSILTALYIYLGYLIYALFFIHPQYIITRPNISEYTELSVTSIQKENLSLEFLPDNLEDFFLRNKLTLTQENRIQLLNYGYTYVPITSDSEDNIGNLYKAYSEITQNNDYVYIPSNTISYYFDYKENQIRKFLNKTEEKDSRYESNRDKKEMNINENIDIVLENNSEDYEYIYNYLEYISKEFPIFNNLRKDASSILELIKTNQVEEEITASKRSILNIIRQLPNIRINEDEMFAYVISFENNSYLIYPDVVSKSAYSSLTINNNNFELEYDIPPVIQPEGSVRIPVLMYHHIDYIPEEGSNFKKGLYVSPESFEKQIAYLTKKNYRSITTEEFYNLLASGQNSTQKTVLLTFDDSTESHYISAYPILKKYGHTGVFFVPSSRSIITFDRLKEMSDNGMDIQSHSATHPDLSKISDTSVLQTEIGGSRGTLESITKKGVRAFAYPGCVGNTTVFNIVQSSGYNLGFSCGKTIDHYYGKRLVLPRVHISEDLERFKSILSGIYY